MIGKSGLAMLAKTGVEDTGCLSSLSLVAESAELLLLSEGLESVPGVVSKGRCLGFVLSVMNLFDNLHSPPVLSTAMGNPFLSENIVFFLSASTLGVVGVAGVPVLAEFVRFGESKYSLFASGTGGGILRW